MERIDDLRRALRRLDPQQARDPASACQALGEKALEQLRKMAAQAIRRVLLRRGLADADGSALGPRYASHLVLLPHGSGLGRECALHDLTQDLLDSGTRLAGLARIAEDPNGNIAGYLVRLAENFIHDLQRKGDRIGAAIYDALCRARDRAIEEGWCRVEEERRRDPRIVLVPPEEDAALAGGAVTAEDVAAALSDVGATAELERKVLRWLGRGTEEDPVERVALLNDRITEQLLEGLRELRRRRFPGMEMSMLVRAVRSLLPELPREQEASLESLGAVGAGSAIDEGEGGAVAALLARVRETIERSPGRQMRRRERLLRALDAIERAHQDGREIREAVRALGFPKQTLSDLMAELRRVFEQCAAEIGARPDRPD